MPGAGNTHFGMSNYTFGVQCVLLETEVHCIGGSTYVQEFEIFGPSTVHLPTTANH